MSDDRQDRLDEAPATEPATRAIEPQLLTGSVRPDIRDAEQLTLAPDGRPDELQPQWRKDFAIDVPQDNYVARRDFAKFLVLTSGAFVAGQGWIAAQSLVRSNRPALERARIASLAELEPGAVLTFNYPREHDPCLLIRTAEGELLAYSQKCTHLSCAVVPRLEEGVLHCPCHEGYFELLTGVNIAGPPPRPLPLIELEVEGDEVYAVAVRERML